MFVRIQVPNVDVPSLDGVNDDVAGNETTVDAEDGDEHLHEQASITDVVNAKAAENNEG